MATLTVLIGDKAINTSDGVGEIFIYLAIKNLPRVHDYFWIQRARRVWMHALKWAGTGLMELEIQELSENNNSMNNMCNILNLILCDLNSFGKSIPVEVLEDVSGRHLRIAGDPPVRPVHEFVYSLFVSLGCKDKLQSVREPDEQAS